MSSSHEQKGIISWFAHNHVAANILMLFLVAVGLIKLSTAVREIFPSIDPRIISISVPYPGATPEDIEDSITKRVEEAVIGIQGVKRVRSDASEGMGLITIELEDFIDGTQILNDVETEVDRLNNFPPLNAEEVTIVKSKAQDIVLSLVVHGKLPENSLRDWAERIRDDIIKLDDISLAELAGAPAREISIEVSEENLRKYNLTIDQVAQKIKGFSVDLPGGILRTQGGEVLVRVQERRYYGSEFGDVIIRSNTDGSLLHLKDVATIRDGFEDIKRISNFNGEPAVFIQISRSSSQDVLKIESSLRGYLKTLALPEAISISIWKNSTDILRARMSLMARNAIMGFVLVFICLLLFLDLKLAVWTSLGIPISFLGGIFIATSLGVTLNMISLFALIVVLGIVVDDTIVAGESIFSEQEEGKKGISATLSGISKIRSPVTVGVLTTVAAFAPLMFSTGILGQILRPIPFIVISILLVSLLEAFLILPSHLASSNKWSMGILAQVRRYISGGLDRFIQNALLPFARLAFKMRYLTVTIGFSICVLAFVFLTSGAIRFIFFPNIEGDEINVTLEMQPGTPFEVTNKYANIIMEAAEKTRQKYDADMPTGKSIYKNIAFRVGAIATNSGPGGDVAGVSSSNVAQIELELVPSENRTVSSGEVERTWQSYVGDIPGVKKLAFESSLIGGGNDIDIQLAHRNDEVLTKASTLLKEQMSAINGVSEVVDSAEKGKREFVFELTKAGLVAGLTPADLGNQLRNAFYGREVDRIQRGSNEVKVIVRYPKAQRETLATISHMRIALPNGKQADLNTMATIKEKYSPTTIKRVDGQRVVSVTGDVDEGVVTPNEVVATITKETLPRILDRYPGLSYKVEGESREQQNDLAVLGKNMLIAVMIIFVMLAAQLRSYIKPFIILLTIPLGVAGAIYGHIILGFDFSFLSLFGIVALSGVVINDSVVLVDYYNRVVGTGVIPFDACLEALQKRFRPILLTTLTTSFGLLPMLLETSLQAQFLIPMAVSLACGIIFASTLLIFVVPSLILIAEDVKSKLGFLKGD